jgi:hypothetical protein
MATIKERAEALKADKKQEEAIEGKIDTKAINKRYKALRKEKGSLTTAQKQNWVFELHGIK